FHRSPPISLPASSTFRQMDGSAGRPWANLSTLLVFLFLSYSPLRPVRQGAIPGAAIEPRVPWSFHLDRSGPRDLRPFALFRQHERGELRGRQDFCLGAELAQAGPHLLRAQALVDGGIELGDDACGRAGGRQDAVPIGGDETGE